MSSQFSKPIPVPLLNRIWRKRDAPTENGDESSSTGATATGALGLRDSRVVQMSLLLFGVVAASYGGNTVSPMQETIQRAFSLTDNQMSVLQGPALALPMVLAAVPLGFVIDRRSRSQLIRLISLLTIVACALTADASAFAVLVMARGLAGLMSLAVVPVALSLVADLYRPEERGHAAMAIGIGQSTGMAAAFALGGALLGSYGVEPDGWRYSMYWLIAPLLPVAILMLWLREPPRTDQRNLPPSERRQWRTLWQGRKAYFPLTTGLIFGQIALWADFMWAGPMLSRNFGRTPQEVGTIMAVGLLVSGVIGAVGGGASADRCYRIGGARLTLAVLSGTSLLSSPLALFPLVSSPITAAVMMAGFLTMLTGAAIMGTALFIVAVPGEVRGLGTALLVMASVLVGNGLAPPMVSALSAATGGPQFIGTSLSLVSAGASIAAFIAFAVGLRSHPVVTAH